MAAKINMASTVGEALNFGGRRMETIMRVAWLPVVLLLVLNMGAVFTALSIANGQMLTFKDAIDVRASYGQATTQAIAQAIPLLMTFSKPMWLLVLSVIATNAILISSFMAPLVRYAGLGEKPAPGVVRVPFGPDQLRFIGSGALSIVLMVLFFYAPIVLSAYFISDFIIDALSVSYASFPNSESLHTIELLPAQEKLTAEGTLWKFEYGYWLGAAAIFGAIAWFGLSLHFAPKNRGYIDEKSFGFVRSLLIFGALSIGAVIALNWVSDGFDEGTIKTTYAMSLLGYVGFLIAAYVNIRALPYLGVVVCRRSFAAAGTFKVTRGWNFIRVAVAFIAVAIVTLFIQWIISAHVFQWIYSAMIYLFEATKTYTRIVGDGETAEWVFPFFSWVWAMIKILYTIFWTFFTYGVTAGLLGRFYRESEREEGALVERDVPVDGEDIWRQ